MNDEGEMVERVEKILEVVDLCIRYRQSQKNIVDKLSFELFKGEILCLHGRSGAGKSTIVWAIMGMLSDYGAVCTGGHVVYGGNLVCSEKMVNRPAWHEIALVPQASMSAFNPVLTIGATLEEQMAFHSMTSGWSWAQKKARMLQLMEMVKLDSGVLDSFPHQLSGGMRQRASIALALVFSPRILVLDEATTGLDILVQADVLGRVLELKRQLGMSVLFISHDSDLAGHFCDRKVHI